MGPERLLVASTALSSVGQVMGGQASYKAGKAQMAADYATARQIEDNAANTLASSQRDALAERRKANLLTSRLRALASKTGSMDVDNLVADINEAGRYNAATALFEGRRIAQGQYSQADSLRLQGRMAYSAGRAKQTSSFLGAAGTNLTAYSYGREKGYWGK